MNDNDPDKTPSEPASPTGNSSNLQRSGGWLGTAFLLALLAFAALFLVTDVDELRRILASADPILLILPLLCVAASYVTMALSYHGIARAAGGHIPFLDMLKITLVANSLNYLLATGGLSGFAARMYYFTKRSISPSNAVVISLAQTFLTNLTLLGFILLGFVQVIAVRELDGPVLASTIATVAALTILAAVATALLCHEKLRRRTIRLFLAAALFVVGQTHSTVTTIDAHRYFSTLDRGIAFLLDNKIKMFIPLTFITLDWIFTILILHTSFLAVHYSLPLHQTIVGFSVGIILSFVSLIPGGLGIMEGSMSAVFAGMGVPFESAVAAALLFRLIYYIVPLLLSFLFLRTMLKQVRQGRA